MSPLISEFDGLKVRMNELDHEPTHVHVVYQRNWKNRLKPGGIVKIPPPSWK